MDERGEIDGNHDQVTPRKEEIRDKGPEIRHRCSFASGGANSLIFLVYGDTVALPPEADICGNLKPISGSKEAGITEFGT